MSEIGVLEVNGKKIGLKDNTARERIGDCNNLKTSTKHCLVDAINELCEGSGGTGSGGSGIPPIVENSERDIEPETYHVYGEVSELSVNLIQKDDGKLHEYCFEFIPTADFTGLTITPEVSWANTPIYLAGMTCQVSVLRGVAIMVNA